MTDLLPCPFCGSEAEMRKTPRIDGYVFVVCRRCGAAGPGMYGHDEARAVEIWNTRIGYSSRTTKYAAVLLKAEDALAEIAKQKKSDEFDTEYDVEVADFEGGFDSCVDRARAALAEIAALTGGGK